MHSRDPLATLALALSVVFQICSLGFGKQAAISMPAFDASSIAGNLYYYLTLTALGLQAIFWQLALRRYPLSFAYFVTAASFLGVLGLSWLVFAETVTLSNGVGTLIIVAGLVVLLRSEEAQS